MRDRQETFRLIGKASAVIILLTLVDKLLAVAKEIMVASRFGISPALDVFNIAYALPGIIGLLFTGAIIAAFVPLYLEWRINESAERADANALTLACLLILFFGTLALLGHFLSPWLFPLMGYGFPAEAKQLGIAIEQMLIFLVLIDGAGILFMAILQAQKRFFNLQTAPLFINIITILLLLFFYRQLGIYTLVWGFLLGALAKVLFLAFSLHRGRFKFSVRLPFDKTKLYAFAALALPLLGSELIVNVNLLVDQVMATSLDAGSVSSLRYAYRVNDMPIQIVILALTVAIFPYVSETVLAKDYEELRHFFKQVIIFLGFLTLPIIALVLIFSHDVIAILFERGAFSPRATRLTAQILLFYSLGLFFNAYNFTNGVFFSALKDTKPLFFMGCLSVGLNIGFNLLFMHFWAVKGIALSTTFTLGIAACIFMSWLNRRIDIEFSSIARNFIRLLAATGLLLLVGFGLKEAALLVHIHRFYYVPAITFLALAVYLGGCWLLRTDEMQFFIDLFKKKKGILTPESK